ncbi:hypothetical protein K435DRAFT_969180 [Dendrothele bispora CBS 962.96]|uniref:Uncharacterized protein n=1 Tax=Dendrothele bispora (strain CBS 962.96) TaxID=1314807 RepID=A0A4S8LJG9_DENBC|nr:hypothetical protein K435DRAFT_969180 [Dendrothele bispora CBS 962.96]
MSTRTKQSFAGATMQSGAGGNAGAYSTGGAGGNIGSGNKGSTQDFSKANLTSGKGGDGSNNLGYWQHSLKGTQWAPASHTGGHGGDGGSIGSSNTNVDQEFTSATLGSGAGGQGVSGRGGSGGNIGSNNE